MEVWYSTHQSGIHDELVLGVPLKSKLEKKEDSQSRETSNGIGKGKCPRLLRCLAEKGSGLEWEEQLGEVRGTRIPIQEKAAFWRKWDSWSIIMSRVLVLKPSISSARAWVWGGSGCDWRVGWTCPGMDIRSNVTHALGWMAECKLIACKSKVAVTRL